jgi:hypothetical protein
MERYANEISKRIKDNDINTYVECDNYIDDYLEIDINELIKRVCSILGCDEENKIIKYNDKKIRVYMEIIIENWISYKYNIEYMKD